MKYEIKFKISILFIFGICNVVVRTQIYSNSQIRFINENKVAVIREERLEIWDPVKKECLDCFKPPHSSYCDIYASSDYLYLINSTVFNIMWRVDIDKSECELELAEYSFEQTSSDEEMLGENIKLYSSNNGKYRIGLIFWENKDKETSCEVAYNNVKFYKSDYIKKALIHDMRCIQISNNGEIILIENFQGDVRLIKPDGFYPIKTPTRIERTNCCLLSPNGKYLLAQTFELLGILSASTGDYEGLFRWEKSYKKLSYFDWNSEHKQYVYFDNGELKYAFRMCDYHQKYDVCPDRLDFFMRTDFAGINVLDVKFSEDETKLLLVTQEVSTYMKNESICIQVFDLNKRAFLKYEKTYKKNDFKGAAISPTGSTIAILTKQENMIFEPLK